MSTDPDQSSGAPADSINNLGQVGTLVVADTISGALEVGGDAAEVYGIQQRR